MSSEGSRRREVASADHDLQGAHHTQTQGCAHHQTLSRPDATSKTSPRKPPFLVSACSQTKASLTGTCRLVRTHNTTKAFLASRNPGDENVVCDGRRQRCLVEQHWSNFKQNGRPLRLLLSIHSERRPEVACSGAKLPLAIRGLGTLRVGASGLRSAKCPLAKA